MRKSARGLIVTILAQKPAKAASTHFFARAQAAPRPQRGLGTAKLCVPAHPPGPRRWPVQSRPSVQIRRRPARFARNKKPDVARSRGNPNLILSALFLSSPHSALSSLLTAAPSDEQAKQWSNGAVAGLLAGVRAPQRVSAPPSSGLAAAPLWPEPGEQIPRLGPLFPARRSARQRGSLSGFPSSPFPLLWFLFALLDLTNWDGN